MSLLHSMWNWGTICYHRSWSSFIWLRLVASFMASCYVDYPDSKVHWANMGPIWGRQDPSGPHVGPMSFAIWVGMTYHQYSSPSKSNPWKHLMSSKLFFCKMWLILPWAHGKCVKMIMGFAGMPLTITWVWYTSDMKQVWYFLLQKTGANWPSVVCHMAAFSWHLCMMLSHISYMSY